jgi:hypothetical protein
MGRYRRGTLFSIAAIPFMTLALWAGSRLTPDHLSLKASAFGAVFLAAGMTFAMFSRAAQNVSDRD